MNVYECVVSAVPTTIALEWERCYGEQVTLQQVVQMQQRFAVHVPGPQQMHAVVLHDSGDWHVVGRVPGVREDYALDTEPWASWAGMAVLDCTGMGLSASQLAAHLLYELCWYGPEDTSAQREELILEELAGAITYEALLSTRQLAGDA